MDDAERRWIDEAIGKCKDAKEKGITVMLVRMQASNDEADMVVTNATAPDMVRELAAVIRAENCDGGDSE